MDGGFSALLRGACCVSSEPYLVQLAATELHFATSGRERTSNCHWSCTAHALDTLAYATARVFMPASFTRRYAHKRGSECPLAVCSFLVTGDARAGGDAAHLPHVRDRGLRQDPQRAASGARVAGDRFGAKSGALCARRLGGHLRHPHLALGAAACRRALRRAPRAAPPCPRVDRARQPMRRRRPRPQLPALLLLAAEFTTTTTIIIVVIVVIVIGRRRGLLAPLRRGRFRRCALRARFVRTERDGRGVCARSPHRRRRALLGRRAQESAAAAAAATPTPTPAATPAAAAAAARLSARCRDRPSGARVCSVARAA
eukprot:6209233-Pleurochrysis_carterae.AAC.2